MAFSVNKWKTTNKKVQSLLNSSIEKDSISDSKFSLLSNDTHEIQNMPYESDSLSHSDISLDHSDKSSSDSSFSDEEHYFSDAPPISDTSDDNDDDDDEDELENELSLSEKLASCAIKNKWTRSSVNELLSVLRENNAELPKDARTLLRTPRHVNIQEKCDGSYFYSGIRTGIERILSQNNFDGDTISIKFNVDGLPLFRSNNFQLWPILGYFHNFEVFVVAIYGGNSKPKPLNDYMGDFVTELSDLLQNGIEIFDKDASYCFLVHALFLS